MRTRIAALVLLVLLAGAYFLFERFERAPSSTSPASTSGESSSAVERASSSGTAPGTAAQSPSADLPSPVDLDAADRDLDLFGRVVDAEGAPVAGARIECLIRPEERIGFRDRWEPDAEMPAGETRSASDGTFSFRLERGDLRDLRVTHPGHAETTLAACLAGERVEVVLHPGARVLVTALDVEERPVAGLRVRFDYLAPSGMCCERRGETDESGVAEIAGLSPGRVWISLAHDRLQCPDLRDLTLVPGETIEVPVLLRAGIEVTGTVRDRESGLPIAGATVVDGRIFLSGRRATTDAEGRYRLGGLQFLEMCAEAEGYGQARLLLPEKIEGPIDFELPRGDTAIGALLDESGRALADVGVAAVMFGANMPVTETRRAMTVEDGSFRIESLHPEGPHTLVVIEPGFARTLLDFDGRLRRPDGLIDLGSIVLRTGWSIEGEFVDAEGAPVPRAGVSIFGHAEDRARLLPGGSDLAIGAGAIFESRRTDDLGRFRFPDLAIGEYQISARVAGWPGVSAKVRIEERGPDPVLVRLVAPSGDEVEFRLVTPEGDPVPEARVIVVKGRDDAVSAFGTTDGDGIVRFGGIPGPFQVRLDLPRGYRHRFPFEVEPRGETETIVVEREARVSGIVLAPDGTPLPRMYLEVIERVPPPGSERGGIPQTKEDGTFELSLSPGIEFDLVASGVCEEGGLHGPSTSVWTGFQGMLTGLVAPAEGLRFRLERVATDRRLVVRVIGAGGAPVEGARIRPSISGFRAELAEAETDAEGIARLEGLPASPLHIECTPPEPPPTSGWKWLPPRLEEVIPAGQECLVELQRGASLTGLVVDEAGAAVGGVVVRADTSLGRHLAVRCIGAEFEFVLIDGETADLEAELRTAAGGKVLRGVLPGVAAGPAPVRIVIRPE